MRDACAGPEVETVSSRHLRDLEANRQNPLEMTANQGPPFEGPDPEAARLTTKLREDRKLEPYTSGRVRTKEYDRKVGSRKL